MAFIPVANGVEIVLEFEGDSKNPKVILGVGLSVPAVLTTLTDITKKVVDLFAEAVVRPWSVDIPLVSVKANALDFATAPTYTNVTGGTSGTLPVAGTVALPVTTSQCAAVVTMLTGYRGRNFRGRNYWPGVPSSYLASNDSITPAAIAAWDTFLDGFIAGMEGAEYPLQVISRYLDRAPRTAGIMTPIITCRPQAKLGTIRKRVGGSFS